jgi:hypothetical protein
MTASRRILVAETGSVTEDRLRIILAAIQTKAANPNTSAGIVFTKFGGMILRLGMIARKAKVISPAP